MFREWKKHTRVSARRHCCSYIFFVFNEYAILLIPNEAGRSQSDQQKNTINILSLPFVYVSRCRSACKRSFQFHAIEFSEIWMHFCNYLVGSSKTMNFGLSTNSNAMAKRFRCPPDSSPVFVNRFSYNPIASNISCICALCERGNKKE